MKIVIDIPEEKYNEIAKYTDAGWCLPYLETAIANGTPLCDSDTLSAEEIDNLLQALSEGEIDEDLWTEIHKEQPVKGDLISRQAAIKYLMDNMTWYSEDGYETDEDEKKSAITSLINGVPSIQPVTGKWKRISMDMYVQHAMAYYECSECGKHIIGEYPYCPFCGTKMEVKE